MNMPSLLLLAFLLTDVTVDGKRFRFVTVDPGTHHGRLFWKSPEGVPYRDFGRSSSHSRSTPRLQTGPARRSILPTSP